MTTWFISRHPRTLEWMRRQGIAFDRHAAQLDPAQVTAGDTVIGSLPIDVAAEICARGAIYLNLSLRLAAADRGRELSADELARFGATLERYDIRKLP